MADETDVEVRFGADTKGVSEGAKDVGRSIEGLKNQVEGFGDIFFKLGEGIAAAFSIERIKEFIVSMAELGEQTVRTSEIFGISTQEVGLLSFAARETGGSAEGLVRSLERMSLSLQQAGAHATPTAIALKALGLSSSEITKLPLPDMLGKIREKFSALPDGMQKTSIAQALVRNGAETLLPVLRMNNEEWNKLRQTFTATGAAMSGDTAAAFAQTDRSIITMKESLTGLGITIFGMIEPAVDALVNGLTELIQGFNRSLHENGLLAAAFQVLTYAIDGVVAGVLTLVASFLVLWQVASAVLTALNDALLGTATGLAAAISGNFAKAGDIAKETWGKIVGDTVDGAGKVEGVLSGYADLIQKLFGIGGKKAIPEITVGGKGGGGGLEFPHAPNALDTALGDSQKQLAALKAQIATLNMGTAAQAEYTEASKLRAIASAANITLTKEDNIAIDAQAKKIGAATAQLQYAKSVQQSLQDLAQGITSAFGAWLSGTDSLGHAFLKLAAQMAEAVAEALILDIILSALGLALPTTGLGSVFAPMFGGGKAQGGPLEMGKWYIAGEKGPEPIWGGGPGAFAQGYPSGEGGGQPAQITYAPTVHALDATGVRRVLSEHGAIFAKTVAQHFDMQPSTRPKH